MTDTALFDLDALTEWEPVWEPELEDFGWHFHPEEKTGLPLVLDAAQWDDQFDGDDLTDVLAQHARPRHVSYWGVSHFPDEHDGLVRKQAQRRARYRREVAA